MDGRLRIGIGTAGLVAGSLGVPAGVLSAWLPASTATAAGVLGVVAVAAGLAAAARPRRLESARLPGVSLRLLAVPLVAALAAVLGSLLTARAVLGPGLAAAVLATLGLFSLRSGAATHHARRVTADAPSLAELPPASGGLSVARQRRIQAAIGVGWLALAAGALWEGGDAALLGVPAWSTYVVLGGCFLLVAVAEDRQWSVTEAGVLVETPLSARLFVWAEFAGYYRGDSFVLLRRVPWVEDVAFDGDEVGAEAYAVLEESLPEREHRGVPVGDRRRASNREAREN